MTATAVITLTFYTSRLCFDPTPLIKDTISELRFLGVVLLPFSQQVNKVLFFFFVAGAAGITEVYVLYFCSLARMLHLSKVSTTRICCLLKLQKIPFCPMSGILRGVTFTILLKFYFIKSLS